VLSASLVFWLVMVGAALRLALDIWEQEKVARAVVAERTAGELDALTGRLAKLAGGIDAVVNGVHTDLQNARHQGSLNEDEILGRLHAAMRRTSAITGLGIAFEPFAYDPGRRLFAPMVERRESGLQDGRLENSYDYTLTYAWYEEALRTGQRWSAPVMDERTGQALITYSRHVTVAGKSAVIFAQAPLTPLREALGFLNLGDHGYAMLLSAQGLIMGHPLDRLARDLVSVSDAAAREEGYFRQMATLFGKAAGDDETDLSSGAFQAKSPVTGQQSDVTWRRVPGPGWIVVTVVSRSDLPLDQELHHRNILLLVAAGVVVLLMLPLLDRLIRGPFLGNWTWSVLASFILLLGIGVVWYVNISRPLVDGELGEAVVSSADLKTMRGRWLANAIMAGQDLPHFIPTGVFVQSVEFITANNVVLTGYIWQRFEDTGATDLPEGFIMPEADTLEVKEAYRRIGDGETVIGWQFRVTLRQTFSYARFPLDWESVWIRLWPRTFEENVVLIPDLESYRIMNPSTLPGVERGIFIGGWTPVSSHISYRNASYHTNFGVDSSGVIQGRPELYFSILIRRNFLDPFVSNLTPIILVLLLIFAMLMTVRREARNLDLLGFNASTIITTCAALFFAVLISHIDLRTSLEAKQIFYLEYFYFITYGVILAVCVNSILFTRDSQLTFIHYKDNLLPKLFYWPAVLGTMFVVTLLAFL